MLRPESKLDEAKNGEDNKGTNKQKENMRRSSHQM